MPARGIVVAITGPDGSGKTTQTARVAALLRGRFRCRTLYLGSNQGGTVVRRSVGRLRTARTRLDNAQSARRGWLHTTGSSLWRLALAARRYQGVVAATRMAADGVIVITDRWPQNVQPGLMDGPSLPPPRTMRIARALSGLEREIYGRMDRHKPALIIQLLCDYATSSSHKPGDLDEERFERRPALLEEMRRSDPNIVAVDGRQSADKVFAALLAEVRRAISDHGVSEADLNRSTRSRARGSTWWTR